MKKNLASALAQGCLEESLAEMMREPGAYWSLAGEAFGLQRRVANKIQTPH